MKALVLILMLTGVLVAADQKKPEEVACRGKIESFDKDGFQAFGVDGDGCETFDVTWVLVKSPAEFSGVRHMLLSKSSDGKSAFGKVGDEISFSAFRSTLDAEKHPERGRIDPKDLIDGRKAQARKRPNQAPEPTATLVMSRACARATPSAAVAHL